MIKTFSKIRKFTKLVLPKIYKSQLKYNPSPSDFFRWNEQFQLSEIFMKKLSFDFDKGRIDKSPHPFCGGGTNDVK